VRGRGPASTGHIAVRGSPVMSGYEAPATAGAAGAAGAGCKEADTLTPTGEVMLIHHTLHPTPYIVQHPVSYMLHPPIYTLHATP
jgi:hypothetical protein